MDRETLRQISIHAPARGATQSAGDKMVKVGISIHAPARGATQSTGSKTNWSHNFNPRTREGCDYRGLTERVYRPNFNPRTREGCDT